MLLAIINFIPPYGFFSLLWHLWHSMFFRLCDIQGPYVARLECYFVIFSSMTTKV